MRTSEFSVARAGIVQDSPPPARMRTGTQPAWPERELLHIDPELFQRDFNRHHFPVDHGLTGHPLFELPRLIELARDTARTRPSDLYYDAGVEEIGQRWGTAPCALDVDETIERIESTNAFIILKRAEHDPAYAKILNACMSDLLQISGRQLERKMRRREVIVFIASPRRLTTYHIDSECNFLLQISGHKQVSVFDRNDREVLPEEEIERFWTVDTNAAVYKPELQDHADVIDLGPGQGLHIPVNAPHWVRNGDDVSVAISINYHSWDRDWAYPYSVNYYLRNKLGINPTPPFQSRWRDAAKRPVGALLTKLRAAKYGPVRKP